MTDFDNPRDPYWVEENDPEAVAHESNRHISNPEETTNPEQVTDDPEQIETYEESSPFDDGCDIGFFADPLRTNFWTPASASMTDKPEQYDDNGDTALTYTIQNAPLLTQCVLSKNEDTLLQTPNQDGLNPISLAAYMCSPDVCPYDSHDYMINFSLLRYLIEQQNVNINQPSLLEKSEDTPNIFPQKNLYDSYYDQPITALDLTDFIFANKKLDIIEVTTDLDQEDRRQLEQLDRQQKELSDYLQNNGAQRNITMPDLGLPAISPSQDQTTGQEIPIKPTRF